MWSVVARIASQKTSAVILTTHLMEEAEALATKMGIMVKGGIFKCFGSSQHIKNKYGVGFEVEAKIDIPTHQQLAALAEAELANCLTQNTDKKSKDHKIYIAAALRQLYQKGDLEPLVLDRIRRELVITYKQAKEKINIEAFEDGILGEYDYADSLDEEREKAVCSAVVFAEKLFTQRNLYGTIKAICQHFGSLELLEQYGNYMRLRVSRQDKTIGMMFGMIDQLKASYRLDQYSISQTTLEQIFQSFANLNFDSQVKEFSLSEDK